jgi:hypothetical protein
MQYLNCPDDNAWPEAISADESLLGPYEYEPTAEMSDDVQRAPSFSGHPATSTASGEGELVSKKVKGENFMIVVK